MLEEGWAWYLVMKKLKELKSRLKVWNVSEYGNWTTKRGTLMDSLNQFGLIAELRPLTVGENLRETNVQTGLLGSGQSGGKFLETTA